MLVYTQMRNKLFEAFFGRPRQRDSPLIYVARSVTPNEKYLCPTLCNK